MCDGGSVACHPSSLTWSVQHLRSQFRNRFWESRLARSV